MVKMTDGDPSPPYLIQPGTNVRLFSDYDGSERRLGESPLTSPPTSTTLSFLGILLQMLAAVRPALLTPAVMLLIPGSLWPIAAAT